MAYVTERFASLYLYGAFIVYHIYIFDELAQSFITHQQSDSLDLALDEIDTMQAPACVANSNLELFINNSIWQESPLCTDLLQSWQASVRAQWQ